MRTKTIILAALFSLVPAVPVMAADPAPAEGPAPAGAAPAAAPAAAGHHPHALRHFIAADKNGYRELLKLADDYDANHDGALDENEVALYKAGLVSHLEADLAGIADFKALDADGSGYITVDELADAGDQTSDGAKKPLPVPGPKKEPAAKRMPRAPGAVPQGPQSRGQPGNPADGATGATELRADGRGPHGHGHDHGFGPGHEPGHGFGPGHEAARDGEGCPDIDVFGKFHHDTGMDYRYLMDFGRIDKDHDYKISEPEYTVWADGIKADLTERLERIKAADFTAADVNRDGKFTFRELKHFFKGLLLAAAPAWQASAAAPAPGAAAPKASEEKAK